MVSCTLEKACFCLRNLCSPQPHHICLWLLILYCASYRTRLGVGLQLLAAHGHHPLRQVDMEAAPLAVAAGDGEGHSECEQNHLLHRLYDHLHLQIR